MKLKVEVRDIKGKNVKKLRRDGKIPAIIYGKHMDDSISIVCDKNEFVKLYRKAWSSTPITLKGDGFEEMVLIYDFQLDPVSDVAIHVDFLALTKWEKVAADVSIVMVWDEEALVVKSWNWSIQLVKDSLAIEALPKDLVKEIEINVSDIDDVNTVLFVRDLKMPAWVEIKDNLDQPVVSVFDLKKWEAAEAAAEEKAALWAVEDVEDVEDEAGWDEDKE